MKTAREIAENCYNDDRFCLDRKTVVSVIERALIEYGDERLDEAASIPQKWVESPSCSGEYPCEHQRLAITIKSEILSLKKGKVNQK